MIISATGSSTKCDPKAKRQAYSHPFEVVEESNNGEARG